MTQHQELNPGRVLAKHAERIAKDHGLIMKHFAILPAVNDGEQDKVQIAMEFDPEAKKPEIILEQADDVLTQAMLEAQKEALEQRAAEARSEIEDMLKKRLGGQGGFLE